MPSAYLQLSEYASYGVPNATSVQVTQASLIIDGYLSRREGLIYGVDGNQAPCYMAAMSPFATLTSVGTIAPGTNINVSVTGPAQTITLGSPQSGLVAILDRANPSITEAVIVNAVNNNVITLNGVQFSHSANALLEFGLVIFEERQMPTGRPIATVSKTPVLKILGGQGRYGYPRRGNSGINAVNEYNLMAAITKFGGPPIWEIFDQTQVGVDPNTGTLWAPSGILLAYYTEIRFSYIAGYTYNSLPPQVKQACASIITSIINMPLNGSIQSHRAGDTAITRFSSTYLDDDTKALLDPFKARLFI